jgi:hypothetical protein
LCGSRSSRNPPLDAALTGNKFAEVLLVGSAGEAESAELGPAEEYPACGGSACACGGRPGPTLGVGAELGSFGIGGPGPIDGLKWSNLIRERSEVEK